MAEEPTPAPSTDPATPPQPDPEPSPDPAEEPAPEGQPEDAPEADKEPAEEPFDRARAEAKIRKANAEAANLRKRLKELEPAAAELQRIRDADKSENERLTERLEKANQQVTETRKRLVTARVQALATGFADPEDALSALDLGSYLDDDGEIDEQAIKADLQDLLQRKPHWAKTAPPPEGPRRPAPDRTQASGANKQRSPLTPADEFAGWLTSTLKK